MDHVAEGRKAEIVLELLDVDHRLQTRLINSLSSSVRQGRAADVGRGLLLDLVEFTRTHFQAESGLMRAQAYSLQPDHEGEHAELLRQLDGLKKAHVAENRPITLETVETIRRLFAGHARGLDRELAEALRTGEKSAGPASPD